MLEENLEQEERKERLENVFFQFDMIRPSSGRKLLYIAGIAFMGLSCLYFGIKNLLLRDELQQIQSGKGVISRIEYNALGKKAKELSAQLGTKKTEVEGLGLELEVLRAQNKAMQIAEPYNSRLQKLKK